MHVARSWPPLESSGIAVLVVLVVLDFQRRFAVFRECKLQLIAFEGQVADLITDDSPIFRHGETPVHSRKLKTMDVSLGTSTKVDVNHHSKNYFEKDIGNFQDTNIS